MYDETRTNTTYGEVRGQIHDGVHTFTGIRYGKDTGPRRFLPPEQPEPWGDVANALEYGPMAPQHDPRNPVRRATHPFNRMIGLTDDLPESEDCLFLNVWTPSTTGSRPVMVWVHSGGFATNSGSAPSTDGALLAREEDVVTVSFNHRLGPLGYTQVSDDPGSPYAASGNVGMLDILAVLRWVRENIASFGGDPGNVTVLGQSGGAMKISTLLAMPEAAGLLHRAILQSGARAHIRPLAEGRDIARQLYSLAGIPDGDVAALATLPLEDLMIASSQLVAEHGLAAASPVVDGVHVPVALDSSALDPERPLPDVPLLIGDLDTETGLFLFGAAESLHPRTDEEIRSRLAAAIGEEGAQTLLAAARRARPDDDGYGISEALFSALLFTADAEHLASLRAAASAQDVRRYRITWRTPVLEGVLGSPHEADVALTFGNIEAAEGLNGGGEDARALSRTLREAWAAFARTGSPLCAEIPEWPVYDESKPVLLLGPEPSLGADVDGDLIRAALPFTSAGINWFRVLG